MKSKTIILSNENEKGRGILTIFQEDDLLQCRLRVYNISKLNRYCKIGIYHNNEVFSANLLEKNGVYTSSMVGDFDIDNDFYSAIIDTQNNNNVIISGGTYSGYFLNDESVFEKEFPNKEIFNDVEKENPNTNLFDYNNNDNCYNNNDSDTQDPSASLWMTNDSLPMTNDSHGMTQKSGLPQNECFEGKAQKLLNNEVCEFNEQTIKESELRACCDLESKRLNKACFGNSQIDVQGSQRSKHSASHGKEEQPLENEVCELESKRLTRACCSSCVYKQFFYSQNNHDYNCDHANKSSQGNPNSSCHYECSASGIEESPNLKTSQHFGDISDSNQTSDESNKTNEKTILDSLVPQFKYVFENYPQDEILNSLIPNGKFVKIEENNNSYSIGAIYDEDQMKYICYATQCDYNAPAPQELGEHYQWLPIDKEDPLSEGYYIVFQDTEDLKIVDL